MQGKDCKTCGLNAPVCTVYGVCDWQPSELYIAYLTENERAYKADVLAKERYAENKELYGHWQNALKQAERFRAALNCECGDGCVEKYGWDDQVVAVEPCPACAEIRKEAKGRMNLQEAIKRELEKLQAENAELHNIALDAINTCRTCAWKQRANDAEKENAELRAVVDISKHVLTIFNRRADLSPSEQYYLMELKAALQQPEGGGDKPKSKPCHCDNCGTWKPFGRFVPTGQWYCDGCLQKLEGGGPC